MEGPDSGKQEHEGNKKESMVEKKRQEAFANVCDELDGKLSKDIGKTFEASGREYELTSAEDCMVAFAQQMRLEMRKLHDDVVAKDDYYEEKATAKLLELFKTYERLVGLYAELRSYYPEAAQRVAEHIPTLETYARHGEELWERVQEDTK